MLRKANPSFLILFFLVALSSYLSLSFLFCRHYNLSASRCTPRSAPRTSTLSTACKSAPLTGLTKSRKRRAIRVPSPWRTFTTACAKTSLTSSSTCPCAPPPAVAATDSPLRYVHQCRLCSVHVAFQRRACRNAKILRSWIAVEAHSPREREKEQK